MTVGESIDRGPPNGLSDPFELAGDGDAGVVLVHGFTGTPYEVRYLGEQLAHAGYDVIAPRLAGHGTTVGELARTTWRDWVASVEASVDSLARRCQRVAIVGQSLGGLLALEIASRRPEICCVGSLATPLWLEGLGARVARWTRPDGVLRGLRTVPKLGGSDIRDRRTRADNPCYDAFPTRALGELVDYMRVTTAALAAVTQPVLVIHGRRDHTAPLACAVRIAEATRARRIRILPRSYHVIAVDVERDIVAAEVIAFLLRYSNSASIKDVSCAM